MNTHTHNIFGIDLKGKLSPLLRLRKNKAVKSFLPKILVLIICIYLGFKLSAIGWTEIFQSLPTSPAFYLLSIVFVFLPIIAERIVFKSASKTKSSPPLRLFIRKHVINKAVMNYAGEGYFITQLSHLKGLTLSSAAIIVKNLNLARTFVANFWILFLVFATILFGNSNILQKMIEVSPLLALLVGVLSLGICLGAIMFYRKLTRLKFSVAGKIAAVYFIRSCLAACVLVAQWSLVLPGTPLSVWYVFLIIYYITKKSPVAGDLVFVSVALTLPGLGSDSAAIAALLLTMTATLQLIYSLGFVLTIKLSKPIELPPETVTP